MVMPVGGFLETDATVVALCAVAVAARGGAAAVGAVRGGGELVAHDRGGRWDPVATGGRTYLTVGSLWVRWILSPDLGPVRP